MRLQGIYCAICKQHAFDCIPMGDRYGRTYWVCNPCSKTVEIDDLTALSRQSCFGILFLLLSEVVLVGLLGFYGETIIEIVRLALKRWLEIQ